NALAALAASRHAGVPVAKAIEALAEFRNVKRRLEVCGTVNGITVYDDFAHHPTAIKTTIAGLRSKVRGARILAVLEPRSNTMKMGIMKDALAGSLAGADLVFCYTNGLGWDAQPVMAPLAAKSTCFNDLGLLIGAVTAQSRSGDHILVMSNGGFGGVHTKILAALDPSSTA
ncbi:MAG: cyanophycin synthetase, partial [Betaproteobacteria bacterium]